MWYMYYLCALLSPKWYYSNMVARSNTAMLQHVHFYTKYKFAKAFLYILYKHTYTQVHQLVDLFGMDDIICNRRYEVISNLLSLQFKFRIYVHVCLYEYTFLSTFSSLFSNAVWCEREIWDLYGLAFKHNLDLRKLLSDYLFEGYSHRKDFPLSGYIELYYDFIKEVVKYREIAFAQEYRIYDLELTWGK